MVFDIFAYYLTAIHWFKVMMNLHTKVLHSILSKGQWRTESLTLVGVWQLKL